MFIFCFYFHELNAIVARPVRKVPGVPESALESSVSFQHLPDLIRISGNYDRHSRVDRIGHGFNESVQRLFAEVALAQIVGFVNEEDATTGSV